MKTFTITAARRRFGAVLDLAMREPVLITRKNGKNAVLISVAAYERMTGAASLGFMTGQKKD
jgi:prevent-host-death family protein